MAEVIKVVKQQFGARLRDDDIEVINEALPEIFPDDNLEEGMTGRKILRGCVEAAVRTTKKKNVSLQADLDKIKELEEQLSEQSQLIIQKDQFLIENKATVQELIAQNEDLSQNLEAANGNASDLQKYVPGEDEMRIDLDPLTKALLVHYSKKVSRKQGKELLPGTILTSLFNRYMTKKEVELPGFPQLVSDRELKAISENLKKEE